MDKAQHEASAAKRSPEELLRELVDALPVLQHGDRTLVVEISKGTIRRRRVTLGPLSATELDALAVLQVDAPRVRED